MSKRTDIAFPINDATALDFEITLPSSVPREITILLGETYDHALSGDSSALVELASALETSCGKEQSGLALFCYREAARRLSKDIDETIEGPEKLPSEDFSTAKKKIISMCEKENVSKTSHTRTGGIYMLYVDCFEDERIIPFYVGRTRAFSKRYIQHLTEIRRLMKIPKAKYNALVEEGEFDGHYLYCKIYSYMDKHGCTIEDVKMVILESVHNADALPAREDHYIQSLGAPLFGFNQYLFFTHLAELQPADNNIEGPIGDILDLMKKEIPNIAFDYEYGYNAVNVALTMPLLGIHGKEAAYLSVRGLDTYLDFLTGYRSEIKEYIKRYDSLVERAYCEEAEGLVTIIPCPAADLARSRLGEMFNEIKDPDKLIELCVDAIFDPKSISSVKVWAEAKKRGFWNDPLYEFKKRYPDVYRICQGSPKPVQPADTAEKKISLWYKSLMKVYYEKFFFT